MNSNFNIDLDLTLILSLSRSLNPDLNLNLNITLILSVGGLALNAGLRLCLLRLRLRLLRLRLLRLRLVSCGLAGLRGSLASSCGLAFAAFGLCVWIAFVFQGCFWRLALRLESVCAFVRAVCCVWDLRLRTLRLRSNAAQTLSK